MFLRWVLKCSCRYDACKNGNGGETEETREPKCISKAFSSSSLGLSSTKVSWEKTIWVDVIILLLKKSGGKYSPKVTEVISFCTKRSPFCTIVCFLLGFFSSFFECRWIFCLHCSFIRVSGYGWDSCFLQVLLHVTNVQPFSLYDIDSLSEQRWRRVS